ncbi:hypothetical protein [Corynebacterium mayonis]|uniref:hypothetical protein n=1 Tax=Corynebacterium mayonis TaxID=3062461 RepID=UPI003140509B
MSLRAKLAVPALAASLSFVGTVGAAPAFAADWKDATIAPGKTAVLTPKDVEKGAAPKNVTVANSEALPAGWSVVSLSGEFRVSAPVNAADGDFVLLKLKQGDKLIDEVTVTVETGESTPAPSANSSETSSNWFSGFVERINNFFA